MTVEEPQAPTADQTDEPEITSTVDLPQKTRFDEFYLSDEVLESLGNIGYEKPTAIQRESIPLILAGIDVIAQAQTGTGKTAACAIPIVEMLDPHPGRVQVLVMAPTRELAKQVCREFEAIGKAKGINATAIYGGTSYEKQYKALKTAQVVAATPGRLLDLLERGKIDMDNLRFFALDEADEMLSMGFREDIEAIVQQLPEERQSLLFSATVNESIKSLAEGILFYPEYITVSSDSVAARTVRHEFYRVTGRRRSRDLVHIIEYVDPHNAIVFANTRKATFAVTEFLKEWGFDARVLNGELPQKEREKTLGLLRQGQLDFLVATDVAARGIDISDLEYVINYELPRDPEVYVHRTGRTGRIGKEGRAISLIAPGELPTYMQIKKFYDIEFHEQQLPTTEEMVTAKERQRLRELPDLLDDIDYLPWGAKLGMADALLEGEVDGDDRRHLLARLLAVSEAVLRRDEVRSALTRVPEAFAGEAERRQPTPGAAEPKTPTEPKQTEEKAKQQDKSAETAEPEEAKAQEAEEQAAEQSEPQKTKKQKKAAKRRRRRSSDDERATQEAEGARRAKSEQDQDEETSQKEPRRRRRRSRGGDQQDTAQQESEAEPTQDTDQEEPVEAGGIEPPSEPDYPVSKMYMDVGRDYFDDSSELQEFLCYMSGMGPEDFGEIVIKSRYSFIEVREDYFYDVINALNNQQYEDTKLTAEPARS